METLQHKTRWNNLLKTLWMLAYVQPRAGKDQGFPSSTLANATKFQMNESLICLIKTPS